MKRIILHLDMDAFFASVEERERPWLEGKPVVVGSDPIHGKGRGVVSTANYAARKYGIHSAMPITKAWQASEDARKRGLPKVVFISPTHSHYGRVGQNIALIVQKYVPIIERASIDELYGDISFVGSYKKAESLARAIKKEIKRGENLTASIGIGPNKLIAKIASDRQKPDGLSVVRPGQVLYFLSNLSINVIPGVGPKTQSILNKRGIKTIREAQNLSRNELVFTFGAWGKAMHKKFCGIDDNPVQESCDIKSIGEQETLETDTLDPQILADTLKSMCENIIKFLRRDGFSSFGRTVLTVRFADFKTVTRSKTLLERSSTSEDLFKSALKSLMPFFDKRENPKRKKIRLVGIRVEKLSN
jgi:DNA polymerase IV (DinB-like DNA polymerase)